MKRPPEARYTHHRDNVQQVSLGRLENYASISITESSQRLNARGSYLLLF